MASSSSPTSASPAPPYSPLPGQSSDDRQIYSPPSKVSQKSAAPPRLWSQSSSAQGRHSADGEPVADSSHSDTHFGADRQGQRQYAEDNGGASLASYPLSGPLSQQSLPDKQQQRSLSGAKYRDDSLHSPLLDCVKVPTSPALLTGNTLSSSTSSSSFAKTRLESGRFHDKDLPRIPSSISVDSGSEDGPSGEATGLTSKSSSQSLFRPGVLSPRTLQAQAGSVLNRFTHAKAPKQSPNARSDSQRDLDNEDSGGDRWILWDAEKSPSIGLGSAGSSRQPYGSGQEHNVDFSPPSSATWLERARVRSASQSASAGLRKWGKASAARLKQAQQARPSGSGREGSNAILGMWNRSTSNLRKYDGGRGAKSTADLASELKNTGEVPPPVPSLASHTARPDPNIGLPTDVRHNVHVDVGPRGYTGLPESWAQVLAQFGINAEDVQRDPQNAAEVVRQQTRYFVDKEAERGQPPENTRRFLESKLYEFEDLRHAILADALDQGEHERAEARTVQQMTVSPTASNLVSPTLPQVETNDDDWGALLLRSLPASSTVTDSSLMDATMEDEECFHAGMPDISTCGRCSINAKSRQKVSRDAPFGQEYEGQTKEIRESRDQDALRDFEEEPSILTASKLTAAKVTRLPHLLQHASESELPWTALGRRDSETSAQDGFQAHSVKPVISHAPTSWNATRSAHNISEPRVRSSSGSVEPNGRQTPLLEDLDNSSSYVNPSARLRDSNTVDSVAHGVPPHIIVATPPPPVLRNRASTDSHLTSSDHEQQLSSGLRERRRAPPRVYPPSASRFMLRDGESAESIGFKRPGSSGRPNSGQGNISRESPLLKPSHHGGADDISIRSSSSAAGRSGDHNVSFSNGGLQTGSQPVTPNSLRRPSETSFFNGSTSERKELASSSSFTAGGSVQEKGTTLPKQHSPEVINRDANGFYKVPTPPAASPSLRTRASNESARFGSPMLYAGHAQHLAENSSGNVFRSSSHTFAANSAQEVQSREGESQSHASPHSPTFFAGRRASQGVGAAPEDYQPASDFINDWLQNDDGSSRRASTATWSEDGLKSVRPSRQSHKCEEIPSVPTIPDLQTLPSAGEAVVPGKHQSPSPALLLGLPPDLRSVTGSKVSLELSHVMKGRQGAPAEANRLQVEHEILSDAAKSEQQSNSQSEHRDWRTRSLPPPPSEGGDDDDAGPSDEAFQHKRSSASSAPDQDKNIDGNGPPLPDGSALEAAAAARLSSRQSRSSSRARKRSQRRSDDARRFPVSMHYASGFDSDALSLDRETVASFSQLMRARQSFDLDDVLPSGIEREMVPPVPPMPHLSDTDKTTGVSLPDILTHLQGIVRPEKPEEALGDMVMIGEGDSGDVFSSIPLINTRISSIEGRGKVAVKIIAVPQHSAQLPSSRLQNLHRELTIWRSVLPHTNVVSLLDAFISYGNTSLPGIWIVQEFMSMSLADVIALVGSGLDMSEEHMSRILLDIVHGLDHLHQCRIVHRDVRSDNILLTFDGVAKISDFTHAASLMAQGGKRSSVVGTAYWMAPEVVKADKYDYKADIWSFGVVIFEMLEGSPPRVDVPALRAITLTAKLGLPALSATKSVSPLLQGCMKWCTELAPADRPSATILEASEYFSRASSHASVADLIEQARSLECEISSQQDEQDGGNDTKAQQEQ